MTTLHQRIGGLAALTVTAAVSLLAGGVILGSASADDGASTATPTVTTAPGEAGNVIRLVNHPDSANGATCYVSYFSGDAPEGLRLPEGAEGLRLPEGAPTISIPTELKLAGVPGEAIDPANVVSFAVSAIGGGVNIRNEAGVIEARPISSEKIEKLKETTEFVAPDVADCVVLPAGSPLPPLHNNP